MNSRSFQSAPLPVPRAFRDEEVLTRRHADEQLDALERARHAEAGPLVRRHAVEVATLERDAPAVGLQDPEQAVEERRLPGAVRAR